jgi:hypothetical protein
LEEKLFDLTIFVKDTVDSSVLSGATVSVNDSVYTTNIDGSTLVSLTMGFHSYTVSKDGYVEKTDWVEISNDTTISILLTELITNVESHNYNSVEIYPNPVEEELHIYTSGSLGNRYSILNFLGQIVISGTLKQNSNTIDLKSLKSGIYLVKVYDEKTELISSKIVKY